MANNVIKRTWNQNKMVCIEDLSGMAFQSESGGHTFEISGTNDSGTAVSLSGTVEARFLRADNVKVTIAGTISSGKASVTLTSNCYTVAGRFSLTIFVTSNSQKVAVYSAVGNVAVTDGVSSGTVPPLVTDSIQTGSMTASGDVTVGGVFDVVNRRASASLADAGWYRVLTFAPGSEAFARGATGHEVVFHITRRRTNQGEETHEIKLLSLYDDMRFVDEVSSCTVGYGRIDKIRCSYGGTNAYVDIHVTGAAAYTTVDFNVYCSPTYQGLYTSNGLSLVADAPSGETILTVYNLLENTAKKIAFTPTSGSSYASYGGCWYAKVGNIVQVHVGISGLTANTATSIYTLPEGFRPLSTCIATGKASANPSYAQIQVSDGGGVQITSTSTYGLCDITYIV
jgi:hypothetical protein